MRSILKRNVWSSPVCLGSEDSVGLRTTWVWRILMKLAVSKEKTESRGQDTGDQL